MYNIMNKMTDYLCMNYNKMAIISNMVFNSSCFLLYYCMLAVVNHKGYRSEIALSSI